MNQILLWKIRESNTDTNMVTTARRSRTRRSNKRNRSMRKTLRQRGGRDAATIMTKLAEATAMKQHVEQLNAAAMQNALAAATVAASSHAAAESAIAAFQEFNAVCKNMLTLSVVDAVSQVPVMSQVAQRISTIYSETEGFAASAQHAAIDALSAADSAQTAAVVPLRLRLSEVVRDQSVATVSKLRKEAAALAIAAAKAATATKKSARDAVADAAAAQRLVKATKDLYMKTIRLLVGRLDAESRTALKIMQKASTPEEVATAHQHEQFTQRAADELRKVIEGAK